MVLDLIQEEVLHIQVEDMVEILLSLELIRAVIHMLITKQEVFEKIDGTTIFAEKMYSSNFTVDNFV